MEPSGLGWLALLLLLCFETRGRRGFCSGFVIWVIFLGTRVGPLFVNSGLSEMELIAMSWSMLTARERDDFKGLPRLRGLGPARPPAQRGS